MEKKSQSSSSSSLNSSSNSSNTTISINNKTTNPPNPNPNPNPSDLYLKHLNKISHKISKPPFRRTQVSISDHQVHHHQEVHDHHHHQEVHYERNQHQSLQQVNQLQNQQQNHHQNQNQNQNQNNHQLHQPPVYNINKSDFRDVVQKLTGSPAHDRFSAPPPIQPPKPPSSRLQRIRPPPLAHVSNNHRPPPPPFHRPPTNTVFPPHPSSSTTAATTAATQNPSFNNQNPNIGRSITPLSPLPPFPSVHGAAESPISAYMRYLQSSTPQPIDADTKLFLALSSPRLNHQHHPNNQQQQFPLSSPTMPMPPSSPFMMPHSPLPFGRISSPRSPYPLLSPSLLFSPTTGFPQFLPQSPRMPVQSPRWRGF